MILILSCINRSDTTLMVVTSIVLQDRNWVSQSGVPGVGEPQNVSKRAITHQLKRSGGRSRLPVRRLVFGFYHDRTWRYRTAKVNAKAKTTGQNYPSEPNKVREPSLNVILITWARAAETPRFFNFHHIILISLC